LQDTVGENGHRRVTIDFNTNKIKADVEKGYAKSKETLQHIEKPIPMAGTNPPQNPAPTLGNEVDRALGRGHRVTEEVNQFLDRFDRSRQVDYTHPPVAPAAVPMSGGQQSQPVFGQPTSGPQPNYYGPSSVPVPYNRPYGGVSEQPNVNQPNFGPPPQPPTYPYYKN
jgi:hypothetical protein